jgi:hypothetical protein
LLTTGCIGVDLVATSLIFIEALKGKGEMGAMPNKTGNQERDGNRTDHIGLISVKYAGDDHGVSIIKTSNFATPYLQKHDKN